MSPLAVAAATVGALLLGAYAVSALELAVAPGARQRGRALLSPLRDGWRLLRQERLVPRDADRLLFHSAPLLALAAVTLAALVLPVGPGLVAVDTPVGIFAFIVLLGPVVVALMNAGWSANARTGLMGAFRAAAHLVAYEVPLGFAVLGPVMHARTLSPTGVVEAQGALWYGVWQPLGLLLYLVSALFMTYRRPFDLPMAGSELGGGVLAEYSGAQLLLFRVALDALFLLLMAMGVVLFSGGWRGPWLPGPLWLALKTLLLSVAVLWVSRRLPRLRHDQMLSLAWKVLIPLGLLNVLLVGALTFIVPGGS